MKEFAPDTFTEDDVLNALERAGLEYKDGSRYILTQCPTHEDKHPSAQIYKDDYFVNCNAGCGRYHISKAFPALREPREPRRSYQRQSPASSTGQKVQEVKYKEFDLMEQWQGMLKFHNPTIEPIHTIPWEVLTDLGWRWANNTNGDIFIPYFSRSKETIPFAQYRHLDGPRRFTMLKDAKPTMYGTWNLIPGSTVFLVEGCSDAAVMQYAEVPWIAAPSASSSALVGAMAGFCAKNDITVIFAGDNDSAGLKLLEPLDEHIAYRIKQARKPYKDWGEMLEAEGVMSVQNYCFEELFPHAKTEIEKKVDMLFPPK